MYMDRRSLFATAIAAGTTLVSFPKPSLAQSLSPCANTDHTARLLGLMQKGDDAFNARDSETVDSVHDTNMIAYITGNAQPIYGRKAHAAAMQQLLQIFPDMHVITPYPLQFGSGDWITVVTRATGTFSGKMTLPDGKAIPGTGKRFDLEFAQTTKWRDDKIVSIAAFWDEAAMSRQIGLAS